MTHIEFAQKIKMPSLQKCAEVWTSLRERRKDHAEKMSKIECNTWTHLRKSYRKFIIGNDRGVHRLPKRLMLYHVSIFNSIHSTQAGKLMKEVIFLDNHTLLHLARLITCLSQHSVSRGFFILNGVVYCDREVDCASFLKKTREKFLENPKDPNMDYYTIKPMKKQYISKLRFELGKPFYFVHGNCQHQVVITNIRISTDEESRNTYEYPLPVYEQLKRRQKCCACTDHTATKVTYNDVHATQSPCFWCDQCFIAFHYKPDGTKQYDEFQVAPYKHD